MKNLILFSLIFLLSFVSFSQDNFKWDKINSITKSKDELYTLTKMYIAETWNSAQDVIQNDDKDAGVIVVKGLCIKSQFFQLNNHKWTFSYTIKFQFKDNKYRIIVDNVYCQSARCEQYDWPLMPVADTYPTEKGFRQTSLTEQKYLEIMSLLKNDLQSIIDGYENYLNTTKGNNSDW